MFLPKALVDSTNRHVQSAPADKSPHFRRNFPGRVDVGGSILRYSTTTEPVVTPIPGGYRITPGV